MERGDIAGVGLYFPLVLASAPAQVLYRLGVGSLSKLVVGSHFFSGGRDPIQTWPL